MKKQITTATRSAGKKENQDDLAVWQEGIEGVIRKETGKLTVQDETVYMAIADGVSSVSKGREASATAIDALLSCNYHSSYKDMLIDWMNKANQMVSSMNLNTRYLQGASTLSCAILHDNKINFSNIGDSPVYRYRNHKLEQMAMLHTLASLKEEYGKDIEPSDSHTLIRFLGDKSRRGDELGYFFESDLKVNDLFLICSDGLSNALLHLEEFLDNPLLNAEQLLNYALPTARDNISIIMIKLLQDSERE